MIKVEVCAGSLEDCVYADQARADRIELNNAIHLGGLTPSIGTLIEAKKHTNIPIVTMVRPRGGGFYYNDYEKATMYEDAKILIKHQTDGLVFGFLDVNRKIDEEVTRKFVELCHKNKVEAIFHRAFDRTADPFYAIETLISCGIDRILTSGLQSTAEQGIKLLAELQQKYGDKIEICVGAGVNEKNVLKIIAETKISQVHSSFKGWYEDPTTSGNEVSYRYSEHGDYEGVSLSKLNSFINILKEESR